MDGRVAPKSAETLIWTIYNSIRNIESGFRCLKTDLDLRPVYHKTDDACQAHLHLGLLAYCGCQYDSAQTQNIGHPFRMARNSPNDEHAEISNNDS